MSRTQTKRCIDGTKAEMDDPSATEELKALCSHAIDTLKALSSFDSDLKSCHLSEHGQDDPNQYGASPVAGVVVLKLPQIDPSYNDIVTYLAEVESKLKPHTGSYVGFEPAIEPELYMFGVHQCHPDLVSLGDDAWEDKEYLSTDTPANAFENKPVRQQKPFVFPELLKKRIVRQLFRASKYQSATQAWITEKQSIQELYRRFIVGITDETRVDLSKVALCLSEQPPQSWLRCSFAPWAEKLLDRYMNSPAVADTAEEDEQVRGVMNESSADDCSRRMLTTTVCV
jgi:hypothetical protein